jgi:hypothetical protein
MRESELGRLARLARGAAPGLAATAAAGPSAFEGAGQLSRCLTETLFPVSETVIDDAGGAYPFGAGAPGYPTGTTVYQELRSSLVNQAGVGQSFDGNGSYLRAYLGGGDTLERESYPAGGLRNDVLFANQAAPTLGTRPTFTASTPPYVPNRPCDNSPAPDINGGSGLPGGVGAPSPEQVP